MVPELKAVLQFMDEMPEVDQRTFALLMALNLKEQEEKRTMTKREIAKLRRLEREERLVRHNKIRQMCGLTPIKRLPF